MGTVSWECLYGVENLIETYFDSKVEYPLLNILLFVCVSTFALF